jgi:hypothetical protein
MNELLQSKGIENPHFLARTALLSGAKKEYAPNCRMSRG